MNKGYVIGVDFGTLSARAILVDAADGTVVDRAVCPYAHGAADRVLGVEGGIPLPDRWCLQVPADYRQALEQSVSELMGRSGAAPRSVRAIACDFTASTVLPTDGEGTALCEKEPFRTQPHAYAKLWKHHAAQDQARRMEALLLERQPRLLDRYGGRVSSEWFLPKMLQLLEEAPDIAERADVVLEATDYVVWQLTGRLCRSTCAAGFKRLWSEESGDVPEDLLAELHPQLPRWCRRALRGDPLPPWQAAGRLTEEWAARLGLTTDTVVAAGSVDAHAAAVGCGITGEGTALSILGTSACQLLLDRRERRAPGVAGCVRDAILPGYCAYETGQSCVGDLLAWFVERQTPHRPPDGAHTAALHRQLTREAADLRPGQSGLLALDWWNGQRSPYMDDDLSGLVLGLTVRTRPAEIYRALLEAIAFGSRLIFDTFEQAGLRAERVIAAGGIARKNPLLMQIYADVLERPVHVPDGEEGSALGAAVYAAVAAGLYPDIPSASAAMTAPGNTVYLPEESHLAPYRELYALYRELAGQFAQNGAMKRLLRLREEGQKSG